jgi:spermidine/putrescine transport system permease protein
MQSWRSQKTAFSALTLPPVVWLLLFFVIPLGVVWLYSFGKTVNVTDIEISGTFSNYFRAVEPLYLEILLKSLWIAGITTFLCVLIAFPVALAITFASPQGKAILLLAIMLPFWTNLLIRTYALIAVLREQGYVNFTLKWLWEHGDGFLTLIGLGSLNLMGDGFEPLRLLYTNGAVVVGLIYVHLPFMVLPLYAALDRLDKSLIEASLDLGAGHLRTLWKVVLPLSKAGIISGVIITFVPALGSYLTPALLGGTDSQMIANVIERQFKSANDWPFGAALSFLLMYVTFFAIAMRTMMERDRSKRP